jgi:hypothetical protein
VAPEVESGNIYLPEPNYAPWIHDFLEELSMFPNVKHDDQCFVAGTMIATDCGDVPIENIRIGDKVIVPGGLSTVCDTGCTGKKSVIENIGLIGTNNHPVFSYRKGFIPLEYMNEREIDKLCLKNLMKWSYLKLLYSMESNTDSWERENIISVRQQQMKDDDMLKDFMLRFMNFIQEKQYKKARLFITKMETHIITSLKIWFAYREQNMLKCISRMMSKNKCDIWQKLENSQKYGMLQKKVANGIAKIAKNFGKSAKLQNMLVFGAERHLNRNSVAENIVPINVDVSIEYRKEYMTEHLFAPSVEKTLISFCPRTQSEFEKPVENENVRLNLQNVYNLTVSGEHVYYANGVLVSNCDSFTQAISSMVMRGSAIVPPKMPNVPKFAESEVNKLFSRTKAGRGRLVAPR